MARRPSSEPTCGAGPLDKLVGSEMTVEQCRSACAGYRCAQGFEPAVPAGASKKSFRCLTAHFWLCDRVDGILLYMWGVQGVG